MQHSPCGPGHIGAVAALDGVGLHCCPVSRVGSRVAGVQMCSGLPDCLQVGRC